MAIDAQQYLDPVEEKVDSIEHWELLTLMLVTGASILALYILLALLAYPFVGVVSLPVYLVCAIVAAGGLVWFQTKRTVRKIRENADPLSKSEAPHVHELVESLAAELEMPVPDVYVVEDETPNAKAVGTREEGSIVLHSGILEVMSDAELRAIIAHELAHLHYRDNLLVLASNWIERAFRRLAWAGALVVVFIGEAVARAANEGRETKAELRRRARRQRILVAVATGLAGALVLLPRNALSRYREFVADRTAAELAGTEPTVDALDTLRRQSQIVENEEAEGDVRSALGPVSYSDRPGGIRGRLWAIVHSDHPSMDRRIDAVESAMADSTDNPSPVDEGAVLGSATKFGLTWGPAVIAAVPLLVLLYAGVEAVFQLGLLADPGGIATFVLLAVLLTWLVSMATFTWAMLFADGGSPFYGFLSVVLLAAFLFAGAVLPDVPVLRHLDLLAYLGLAGIAALHLRDVVEELR